MATRALTVRLDEEDYERLEEVAQQLGVLPGTLARMLLRGGLRDGSGSTVSGGISAALARSAALRQRLPTESPVDVVQLIREGREELDHRGSP